MILAFSWNGFEDQIAFLQVFTANKKTVKIKANPLLLF